MAAQGKAGQHLNEVRQRLQEHNLDFSILQTSGPGHAIELSRAAAGQGFDVVAAAGGDGTINEVINGLMASAAEAGARPALGVLPVGRGNDFAFGAGIPADLPGACLALARDRRKRIDIGRVTGGNFPAGRCFGNGIGLGFDTVVGFEAAKMKRIQGPLAYLAAVVKTISLYHTAPTYAVTYDGTLLEQPFLMVSIMNGRRMGGSFMMTPTSRPDDGLFDLCLVGHVSQPGILKLVPRFIQGTQAAHPAVKMAQARSIHIRAIAGSIPAHADGETVCTAGTDLLVEMLPAALDLLTAPAEAQA
jgi:YegS/Rv2252/BmrU family lipid kinase